MTPRAVTAPPILQLFRPKRFRTLSPSRGDADRKKYRLRWRRSSSSGRSRALDRYYRRGKSRSQERYSFQSQGLLRNSTTRTQNMTPRSFFRNKSGHAFTDCDWWKEWVKEDSNSKYFSINCHQGWHNARNYRRPRGVFWDTPYESKKAVAAALTPAVSTSRSTKLQEES